MDVYDDDNTIFIGTTFCNKQKWKKHYASESEFADIDIEE
jgi:hypothetical protein